MVIKRSVKVAFPHHSVSGKQQESDCDKALGAMDDLMLHGVVCFACMYAVHDVMPSALNIQKRASRGLWNNLKFSAKATCSWLLSPRSSLCCYF